MVPSNVITTVVHRLPKLLGSNGMMFQLAGVAVPREVFRQVLERTGGLHPAPG